MRYELSDDEWAIIRPMLPNGARGVPRVDDRRVLNGIFWVLRSGDRRWRRPKTCTGADNSLQALGAAGPLAWAAALVLAGYSHSGRPAFRSPSSNLAICSGRHGIRSLTSDIRYGE